MGALALTLLLATTQWGVVQGQNASYSPPSALPESDAMPAPPYMVDNTRNYYHVAPDKGKQNGPVWQYSGSLENYMNNLANNKVIRGAIAGINGTITTPVQITTGLLGSGSGSELTGLIPNPATSNLTNLLTKRAAAASSYWLTTLAPLGSQPLAGSGYQFYRDVTLFGADPTGASDSSEAINAAVSSWSQGSGSGGKTRCGRTCGNSFSQGAIVYFPPGTYKICTPVIQYYYTQFIGDVTSPPTIKGCSTFKGIALFDTDPYIPGGSGAEWYINQNQFLRQIRNFVFDLNDMPNSIEENDQALVPTGIHWQVAQGTSLQNIVFNMPTSKGTTAVGIFMENGSGGFVSDLTFNGGNIGWRAGSQQYTARNLVFNNCLTSIQMVWDWGFNWQGITINGGSIGLNISGVGGVGSQGIGSISLIDSSINSVGVGILTNNLGTSPNIVLDNTVFKNVGTTIQIQNGGALLTGSPQLWAAGARYNGGTGSQQTGPVAAPTKAPSLLTSSGAIFTRSRPQYEAASAGSFLVATRDGGCKNDGTGDQAGCINAFLQKAVGAGQIAYFPAGIYRVGGTVFVPTGSVVQGSSWSQIQGAGYYFSDIKNPRVVVRVGNPGERGKMEIVEMLFSVQGNTAGAVLMEWNVAASAQGSACMWDSHFRVGGALGTDLDLSNCPKNSNNAQCIAASLMFRVTAQASGYFENVWAWVADHDNDRSLYNVPDSSSTQISVFGARGMLIESQGPSWFIGTSSEHSVLYNYQISGANNIYMGHIQTESPYYQPLPAAPAPFGAAAASFPNDPDFSNCPTAASEEFDLCHYAWGLRVVNSNNVYIHGAGLYSFFNDYYQDCVGTNNCQEKILEVVGSVGVVIFNLFTVAIVKPANGIKNSFLSQPNVQRGFSTETSVWIPLFGVDVNVVYVGPAVFSSPTASCPSTCLLVFPTSTLSAPSTISIGTYVTSFQYGSLTTTTINNAPQVIFVTSTTTVTISVPSITISGLPFSNVNVTSGGPTPITIYPSVDVPPVTVSLPNGSGGTTPRVVTLPPWPMISAGPSGIASVTDPGTVSPGTSGASTTYYTPLTSLITAKSSGVTTLTFPATASPSSISCPATTALTFATPSITVVTTCTSSGVSSYAFACPTTKVVTFLGPTTGVVSVDCSLVTLFSSGGALSDSSTTTPLPVYTTYPLYASITPIATSVPSPVVSGRGVKVPCRAWFFFICISTPKINIGGFYWNLPAGIYPPGPPPLDIIMFPPGYTIEGNLPPWPRITIGNDGQITSEQQSSCQTQSASICSYTTSFGVSGTKTTTTSTSSTCETITGCSISGRDYSTTTIASQGTQALAPVGTEFDESWNTAVNAAFASSVYAAFSRSVSSVRATGSGTIISFTTGPTPAPTCAGSTACGGKICSGYYCSATPTGYPPGYQAPNDPNSGGYVAPTTTITGKPSTTSSPVPPPPTLVSFIAAIQRNILVVGKGGSPNNVWYWEVINAKTSASPTVCTERAIWTSANGQKSDSNFATTLGPFSISGHGQCSYAGPTNAPGSMGCQDRYSATCTTYVPASRSTPISCATGNGNPAKDDYYPQFYCYYG